GLDWQRDLQDQVKRDFLGPVEFGELFGSRGVSDDHTIVLYGDRSNWFAAYTYWYLKYYGHETVKLMNGPRDKWIAEDRRRRRTCRNTRPRSSRRRSRTSRSARSATKSWGWSARTRDSSTCALPRSSRAR